MTTAGRRSAGGDRRWIARIAGALLVTDGLRRILERRVTQRFVGGTETVLGLALLERVPIEPESLYRAIAPIYDLLSPVWRDWLYRAPLQAFDGAIATALPDRADVVDLGCGTGAVLERLRALNARFGTYTGVDLSPAMLARAQAKFGRLPDVRFERRDLRTEPMPAGPFDLVVSAWALEHLPEPARVVAAARSRVRPGGRVVLFFELDGAGSRAWAVRRLWRLFGVHLVPEREARSWPGLISLRRFGGLGPEVAVAVLEAERSPVA